jgi:hypothetical protein
VEANSQNGLKNWLRRAGRRLLERSSSGRPAHVYAGIRGVTDPADAGVPPRSSPLAIRVTCTRIAKAIAHSSGRSDYKAHSGAHNLLSSEKSKNFLTHASQVMSAILRGGAESVLKIPGEFRGKNVIPTEILPCCRRRVWVVVPKAKGVYKSRSCMM